MPRAPCIGRLAADHAWLCAATTMRPRSIRSSMRTIPGCQAGIGSPKFTMVLGPFNKTELFFGAGKGMHSNDARGATITEDPTDPTTKVSASPLLVVPRALRPVSGPRSFPVSIHRSACSSSTRHPRSSSAAMPATPRQAGPASVTGSSGPTGIGRSPGLTLDGDLALTHARFVGSTTIRRRFMPRLQDFRRRRSATRPATIFPMRPRWWHRQASRSARRQAGSALALALSGCQPTHRRQCFPVAAHKHLQRPRGLPIRQRVADPTRRLNLLNTKTNQITYAYGSLIKTDSLYNIVFQYRWRQRRSARTASWTAFCIRSSRCRSG